MKIRAFWRNYCVQNKPETDKTEAVANTLYCYFFELSTSDVGPIWGSWIENKLTP